jgi:hypothetical protein
MQYWMRNSGSAQHPFTRDDWKAEQGPLWPTVNYPRSKRPSARRGDRMFWHAIGSGASFGRARFFALGEVTSDEPFLTDHERWPWALEVDILVEVPLLSRAPTISQVGIEPRSLSRQSHIKMSPAQGELAERLLYKAASN